MPDIKNKIKPVTFYDELAEYGFLEDYLNTFFKERINKDQKFRIEMYETLVKHSKNPLNLLDAFYLEKLCESLGFFLEYIKPWTQKA